ncbi:PREDICTED: uncharacterized protein LOC106741912 [Dinoponera quadriceps]|uniref:Uncharacterized protein LOC106741912 n=1 Tax=Dinoponera quadriceps TaxID=609295 RepID=A0A6P3WUQ5_DINQU|nr:PREDICTED: uncharacterized protein LOC106741912 [Dinoponera quadriceps]
MIISSRVDRGKFLTGRAFMQLRGLASKFQKRRFESSTHDPSGAQLRQTTIFAQEGAHIQEVPVIVRRITDVEAFCDTTTSKRPVETPMPNSRYLDKFKKDKRGKDIPSTHDTSKKKSVSIETDEGTAVLFYSEDLKSTDAERLLHAITSGKETYSSLKTKIADEINCRMALQGLRRILELENGWHAYRKALSSERSFSEAVNRDTILRQLVSLIVKSKDNEVILQGLRALKRDRFSPARNVYRDWLCNEATVRATDGSLTVSQLMRLMRLLASYKEPKYRNCIDLLWMGLACRERDIKPDMLVPLFKSLKYFRQSKNMVRTILERKLSEQWLRLNGSQMADILDCFHGKEPPNRCLSSASKWASVSMTSSGERNLADFVRSLRTKSHVDENVEQALERYVTVRGGEMKDADLVASIMDYCKGLKVRNSRILAECGRYFVRNGMDVSPSLLASVLTPFGSLNVQPPDPTVFWKIFDEVLSVRFAELKLSDTLDILLSCTYLERYPVKFLDKVFSSYLLNRLQIQRDAPVVNRLKTKLILFDTTMSLECKDYQGSPINIDKSTKLLSADVRIRSIVSQIYKPLGRLVGGEHKLSRAVALSKLPLINFYISDLLIHPLVKSTPVFNLDLHKKRNINTAILIHLPEYYCRNSRHLIGPQVMRKRQMRKLGFRVACLDYARLTELASQRDKLTSYLSQSLDSVEDAL